MLQEFVWLLAVEAEDGHTTTYCNATGKPLTLFVLSITAKLTAHFLNNTHLLDTVNLMSNFQVK